MLERYVPDIVMEHVIEAAHSFNTKKYGGTEIRRNSETSTASTEDGDEDNNDDRTVQRLYEHEAVVVLADISGFTKLAERLAKDNTGGEGRGTETLSRMLNSYFGRMIDMIYMGGGDVVKFAGDALLVVWRRKDEEREGSVLNRNQRKSSQSTSSASGSQHNTDTNHHHQQQQQHTRRRRSSRRPSVELPPMMSGIMDTMTGQFRRTSLASSNDASSEKKRRASTAASTDTINDASINGQKRRPSMTTNARRRRSSGLRIEKNINNLRKSSSSSSSISPRQSPSVRSSFGTSTSRATFRRRKSSLLLASEAASLLDTKNKSNVEHERMSSSSSSSSDRGSDDDEAPTDVVVKITSNDERATRILRIGSKTPKKSTSTPSTPTIAPMPSNVRRRSSLKKSKSGRTLKRRDSWRTTMTNWRKQKIRTRGSVHDVLEARRRSIVGMKSVGNSPRSSAGTDDLDVHERMSSIETNGTSFTNNYDDDSDDEDADGNIVLYRESYKSGSESGSESESNNNSAPSSPNLAPRTSIDGVTSSLRHMNTNLAPIRDMEDDEDTSSGNIRTSALPSSLPPPLPSTQPSFITPPIVKFVDALRLKLNSGKITGDEYVQMVTKQLEMHALGMVNEVNVPMSRKERGESEEEDEDGSSGITSGDMVNGEHWSPSESRLRRMCHKMASHVIIKDRRKMLRWCKKCFVGHEAAIYLMSSEGMSKENAVRVGNMMVTLGLIERCTSGSGNAKNYFRDDSTLYRFTRKSKGSPQVNAAGRNTSHVLEQTIQTSSPSLSPQSYKQQLALLQSMAPTYKSTSVDGNTTDRGHRQKRSNLKLSHLADVVHRCVHSCLNMVNKLDNFEGLRLHVGIGCGNVLFMHVGGVCERLEFIVAGEALVHMSHAEAQSKAGDVCVSSNVWDMIKHCSFGHPTLDTFEAMSDTTNADQNSAYLVVSVNEEPLPNPSERRWLMWDRERHPDVYPEPCKENGGRPVRPMQIGRQVMLYVPGAVRNKLAHLHAGTQFSRGSLQAATGMNADTAKRSMPTNRPEIFSKTHSEATAPNGGAVGLVDQQKLFEFRRASILFVNLPGIDYGAEAETVLCTLQHALVSMQEILVDLEGSLRQFIMDDKGTTLIGVFGLYPAHENDPHLATQCAMEMVKRLRRLDMVPKIGVTTGNVFAAEVGNERRCEFAVIGDVVNLSARLMVAAGKLSKSTKSDVNILCDASTWKVARTHIRFRAMTPIRVKGKTNKIMIYQPMEVGNSDDDDGDRVNFVGNRGAREQCLSMFQRLLVKGKGGVVLIDGNVGTGKTRLLREVLREAREKDFSLSSTSASKKNGGRREFLRFGSYKKNEIYTMMSAADPISQFVPFSGVFEVALHMLKRLRCVEEYVEIATGDRLLRLSTKNTKVGERRKGSRRGRENGSGTHLSLVRRLHLLNRVFPQLGLAVSEMSKEAALGGDRSDFSTARNLEDLEDERKSSSSHFSASFTSSGSDMFEQLMPVDEANELHESVRDILLLLVEEYVGFRGKTALVLTFDDGQWMDTWSWSFIVQLKNRIIEEGWPLLILTATRTMTPNSQESSEVESKRGDVEGQTKGSGSMMTKSKSRSMYVGVNDNVTGNNPARQNRRQSFSSRILTLKNLHSRSVASSSSNVGTTSGTLRESSLSMTGSEDTSSSSSTNRRRSLSENSNTSNQSSDQTRSGDFSRTYIKHLISSGGDGAVHVSMLPLSREETGALMAGVIGAAPPLRIVQHVLNRTKGNPLYIIETTQGLLALGILAVVLDECQITSTHNTTDLHLNVPLPDTLQGILRSNIDRLPSSTQEILQIASVAAVSSSPVTLDLLYDMFVGEQLWNSQSMSHDSGEPVGSDLDHEKAYTHVKKEIHKLVKSKRLVVARSNAGLVRPRSKRQNTKQPSSAPAATATTATTASTATTATSDVTAAAAAAVSSTSSWSHRVLRFARDELQEIAYKISPFSVRQRLHHRAALYYERLLADKYPKNAPPALRGSNAAYNVMIEVVALHFELAGAFTAAAKYVSRAMDIYAHNYEYTKEVQLLRQMKRLLDQDPECGSFVTGAFHNGLHGAHGRGRSSIDPLSGRNTTEKRVADTQLHSAMAIVHSRLGDGLLHLGVLTEAEKHLCLSLSELGEYVDISKTLINAPDRSVARQTSRLSVFTRSSSSSLSPSGSPISFLSSTQRKQQRTRLANHVSAYQYLMTKVGRSISAWSSINVSGTHHKSSEFQTIFTSCRVRITLAQVQHELNHPFRGLVILYDAIVMALSTNGPSPLLAEALACLGELARSVLENTKLSLSAIQHAKAVAANIYSPPTTAFIQRHEAKIQLIKGDLDEATRSCRSACLILGDLNDVRALEKVSLLIGDCYVLQGRPWPSLTEYAQVLDSARLRSDWRIQLSALFGQAFVHFIGRNWKSASSAVGLCESLVTDIVAALDSATVITVRSFILLAEISQYKVDTDVLHSTIDMVLGTSSEQNNGSPLSTASSSPLHQNEQHQAKDFGGVFSGNSATFNDSTTPTSVSTAASAGTFVTPDSGGATEIKISQLSDNAGGGSSGGGAFVDAGRSFQYHHRALYVYYAIIMSSLTILESSKFDEVLKKERKANMSAGGKSSFDTKRSMSSMISKKMRKMSAYLGRGSTTSNSSSGGGSPQNYTDQEHHQPLDHSSSTIDRVVHSNDRGDGFGSASSTASGEVKLTPRKRVSTGYELQTPREHAQRHLAFGLGTGMLRHGQGLMLSLGSNDVVGQSKKMKKLNDKVHLLLKSMKHFVHSSYPVGTSM